MCTIKLGCIIIIIITFYVHALVHWSVRVIARSLRIRLSILKKEGDGEEGEGLYVVHGLARLDHGHRGEFVAAQHGRWRYGCHDAPKSPQSPQGSSKGEGPILAALLYGCGGYFPFQPFLVTTT